MADNKVMMAAVLAAGVMTDITGGGVPAGSAGSYTLNLCNDTAGAASLSAVYVVPAGVVVAAGATPPPAYKTNPSDTVDALGWNFIQPILLGDGWKVFVQSDTAISAQLVGRKEA